MSVRAKFTVCEVRHHSWSEEARTVVLRPQYDQSIPEDRRFSDATPSGELTMLVNNPAAVAQLGVGKAFYLDLTPVE